MAKPFEMYVFDWDGTLMDTTRLIMQGYQHASKALGFPVPSGRTGTFDYRAQSF